MLGCFPKKPCQRKSKQDLNLYFAFGYKGNFNISLDTVSSRDFTNDDVDGFVGKFFALNTFKCRCVTFDFANPTDISPIFGLKCDVSGYLFSKGNLDPSVAVDEFGVDILVPVYNSATRDTQIVGSVRPGNFIVQYLGAISPSDPKCEFTKGEGTCDSHSFACDLDSAGTCRDIIRCIVEGNRNSSIRGNFSTRRGCPYEVNRNRFGYNWVLVTTAASEQTCNNTELLNNFVIGKCLRKNYCATTLFCKTPMPSISISTTSPAFNAVVVPGVPVKIASPGSRVIACEMKLTIVVTGKIRSAVVCF